MATKLEKKYDHTLKSGIVTFVMGERKMEIDYDALPGNIQRQLGFHGLVQKIGDGAAIQKAEDGTPPTDDEKWERMSAIAGRLAVGEFGAERVAGTARPTSTIEALARIQAARSVGVQLVVGGKVDTGAILGVPMPDGLIARATDAWEGWSEEARKKQRSNPIVKAVVAAIRAARTADVASAEGEVAEF